MRVYKGSDIHSSAAFKTLCVTADMTVSHVIDLSKSKFGVEDDPREFILEEVSFQDGMHARRMAADESVFDAKINFGKNCINDRHYRLYMKTGMWGGVCVREKGRE